MTRNALTLDKSHLLAFLVRPCIGFTDHYVSSQDLSLFIPYSEYLEVVKEVSSLNLDILRTPVSVYRGCLQDELHPEKMVKLFHRDIALSSLSEVCKSYPRRFQCTRIFGTMDISCSRKVVELKPHESADFVVSNFSQQEQQTLIKEVLNLHDIKSEILKPAEDKTLYDTYMFYRALALYGVYLFNKNFVISFKEDS